MPTRNCLLLAFLTAVLVVCGGCPPPSEIGPPPGDAATGSEDAAGAKGEKGEFVFGDLIEPFDPPTLDELNAQVEWVDQPVLDSMVLLRERQKGEEVLATVAQALYAAE